MAPNCGGNEMKRNALAELGSEPDGYGIAESIDEKAQNGSGVQGDGKAEPRIAMARRR